MGSEKEIGQGIIKAMGAFQEGRGFRLKKEIKTAGEMTSPQPPKGVPQS